MNTKITKATWAGLWTLTALSIGVGAYGLYVSYHASQRTEYYQQQCIRLLHENSDLRMKLAEATPTTKQELIISVAGSEYAPKTLALKNRNYLNIKQLRNGDKWKGSLGVDEHGHVIFESPAWSIRAGALVLKSYEHKHGLKTVKELVHRFAEGNRDPYIKHLCKALGVKPDQKISFTKHLPELLKAMVVFETGQKLGREHLALVAALR